MGYLRPVRSPTPAAALAPSTCLAAFERDLDYLFATLQRLGANPRDVEDLVQEVFVVLHRNWSDLDTSRPLRPYLFGIAFRLVLAHRRRRTREVPHAELEVSDDAAGPDDLFENSESTALLLEALDRVPLPRRAVVVMHDLDGVAVTDIARTLSITRFGAYARLRKARKELAAAVRRLSKDRGRR